MTVIDQGVRRAKPVGGAVHPRALLCLAVLVTLSALGGCARSAAQVRWDNGFDAAVGRARSGDVRGAVHEFERLEAIAPRGSDRGAAALARAGALVASGQTAAGIAAYLHIGRTAVRKPDRARAYYTVASWLEDAGQLDAATAAYRRIVRTYPDLMPGERSLRHLERLAQGAEDRGQDPVAMLRDHLRWSHRAYAVLQETDLGDDLLYFPASLAHQRFKATGDGAWAALAEALYKRIDVEQPWSGHWNDAWWQRSLLYHRQGRYEEEVWCLRRILATFVAVSIFGSDEHEYFWKGLLRIARIRMQDQDRPAEAARMYRAYAERYPQSIRRDDAAFYEGCAWLRAGASARAEERLSDIPAIYAESKFLRRLDAARTDPYGTHCVPDDVVEGQW